MLKSPLTLAAIFPGYDGLHDEDEDVVWWCGERMWCGGAVRGVVCCGVRSGVVVRCGGVVWWVW